jgi:hypothetical protein
LPNLVTSPPGSTSSIFDALREALEACWDERTSYLGVKQPGNAALGQCYPTCRVVQHCVPEAEIIRGKVWTGERCEDHFWNGLVEGGVLRHVDLTWQQFPPGSCVREWAILDRRSLDDSAGTQARCALLLARVIDRLRVASQARG